MLLLHKMEQNPHNYSEECFRINRKQGFSAMATLSFLNTTVFAMT